MTQGSPLVSPGFGAVDAADPRWRTDESNARRRTALQKEPAIGDGSQSREKRQSKSIRGSVMCHNSHTERGNPWESTAI
jgi:hypothetical protein